MAEWEYARADASEELAELRVFSMKKHQPGGDVTFCITVREYAVPPPGQHLRFFAESDKQVNQKTAAFLPSGWGSSQLKALSDCMKLIRQFPYEGEE